MWKTSEFNKMVDILDHKNTQINLKNFNRKKVQRGDCTTGRVVSISDNNKIKKL